MRNVILSSVAVVGLFFTGCLSEESTTTGGSMHALLGTYYGECENDSDESSLKTVWAIQSTSIIVHVKNYTGYNCQEANLVSTISVSGPATLGDETTFENQGSSFVAYKVDFEITTVEATPHTQDGINDLQTFAPAYSYTINQPTDVSANEHVQGIKQAKLYTIFALSENKLYFGKTYNDGDQAYDGKSAATRHTAINTRMVHTKQ